MHQTLLVVCGFLLVAAVSFDVFQAVIVPRMTSRRFRMAPFLIGTVWWSGYRKLCSWLPEHLQSGALNFYAPLSFIGLFVLWFAMLIAGFSLMLLGLGQYVQPPITNFSQASYLAGTSVLTLGFGDVVASHWSTRLIVLSAAMLGIVFLALQVSYLFTLQTHLQQREQVVNTLNSRAGSPASGLVLLLRYKELAIVPSLSTSFLLWENWVANILESHRVFPLLMYFRSSTSDNSWVSSIGALCDAATLLFTTIEGASVGEANLFYWLAIKTLKSLSEYVDLTPVDDPDISRPDWNDGLALLQDAGYTLKEDREQSWKRFCELRSGYMQFLVPLSDRFVIPLQIWMIKLSF